MIVDYHDRAGRTHRSVDEIEWALITVALEGGNVEAAVRILNASRHEATKPFRTSAMRRWVRDDFADRYNQIVEERMEQIDRLAGMRTNQLAEDAREATAGFVEESRKALKKGLFEARDLPSAARNLSQVHANSVDKARVQLDKPTEIHDFNLRDSVDELRELLGTKSPEAIDAEVVEE